MRRTIMAIAVGLMAAALVGGTVAAQDSDTTEPATDTSGTVADVDVLQVAGLVDEIVASEIETGIERAAANGSQALVLQVDSRGSALDDDRIAELMAAVADADVPVAIWVGPSGSKMLGTPAQLLAVADVTGMSPGSKVGHVGDPVSDDYDIGAALTTLEERVVGLSDARDLGVFKQRIPDAGIATLPNMIDALDGFEDGDVVLDTTVEVQTENGTTQRETIATPRFFKLGLMDELFHTVASPEVTYLLLLIGLALLIFEFFTAGIGIAAVVGAGCVVLSASGLAALPTRPWALALVLIAMVAFAVDVQVGIPRFWTAVGIGLTIIASFTLFAPVGNTSLRPSWLSLIAGIGGVILTFIVGMPSMTRTRFATPTIGREWMLGMQGVAVSAVSPEGIVQINDAEWRARTNRATPLEAGEELRVVAIDGVTLEVEPLEGAAKDYREMRNKKGSDPFLTDQGDQRPGPQEGV